MHATSAKQNITCLVGHSGGNTNKKKFARWESQIFFLHGVLQMSPILQGVKAYLPILLLR
jgi:hypothetical protein